MTPTLRTRTGAWVIREIESPTGFVLSEEEIAVTVGKVDEVVEIELVNYFIKGNIELTKVDADYPDNKLTGAVFEVYADTNGNGEFDKDDKLCGEMTELEGGVYQMTELRYGKYFVREKTAPDGFVLDDGVYGVSIEENGKTYTVENKAGVGFINDAQKGSLKIVKTSSDGKVEGFSFRVTSADGTFNIYDDVREKLVARGIPAEQIRFIHEATSDAQKKELFAKVRSGEVRVLLGSTPKMGAGTNVQDRLIAIHNLDCPWRPSDLEQRQGRIERQGNMFPEVEVYRYVTEQTFDAYLYQLVESKQKFISQIMTSKSPVRSAEDVDEVALSFAEVKMLATGDERFKEKMDLDIQVSKLKVLKQSYLSEHYDLEDRILKHFPQTIAEYEQRIVCYKADTALTEQHKPQGEEKFCPMTLRGISYTEKAAAGEMLLAICKEYPLSAPIEIGSYRGFKMEIFYDTVGTHYCLNLCGQAKYKVELGSDPLGNLTRIENELAKLPARLEAAQIKLAETIEQLETAKVEVQKPFTFEEELKEKSERLNALNIELNLDKKDPAVLDAEPEEAEEQPERKCANRER